PPPAPTRWHGNPPPPIRRRIQPKSCRGAPRKPTAAAPPLTLPTPATRLASIFPWASDLQIICPQDLPLRAFRSTRRLLDDVKRVLASSHPSFGNSPLEEVADLLCRGRH